MTVLQAGNGSTTTRTEHLQISGLARPPADAWKALKRFAGPTPAEQRAMRQTVDVLFRRGYELVVATYDHLAQTPETAEILGWEGGMDEAHLAERRRFFTIWLARTLSLDLGTDFALYLFRAGQVHAGHGPRHIHTPPLWVTGSMGLVLGAFADFIRAEHDDVNVVAPALAGWNKYLMMQLNQMQAGYVAACRLDEGAFAVPVRAFARLRDLLPPPLEAVRLHRDSTLADLLRKLIDAVPALGLEMLEQGWHSFDDAADDWLRVEPVYTLRAGWRVLVNGKDVRYGGGFDQALAPGDQVELFPPGR